MSFKFNFDLEEPESGDGTSQSPTIDQVTAAETAPSAEEAESVWDEKSYCVSMDELLDTLPSRILYSPLPLPFHLPHPLLRRDLHDARFQLASTSTLPASQLPDGARAGSGENAGDEEKDQGEAYVSAGAGTDLIPGLYEGGLKTWEGGVDLVQVLSGIGEGGGGVGEWVKGRGVIEIGCGTALPSAYILSRLLSDKREGSPSSASGPSSTHPTPPTSSRPTTRLLLQDYNLPVLILVSLPNLLLAALPHLPMTLLEPISSAEDTDATHLAEIEAAPDFSDPGELEITSELKDAFKRLLDERGVQLEFRYGGWRGLANELKGGEGYGLVLSSETIYAEGSVGDLMGALRTASGTSGNREKRTSAGSEEDGEGGLGIEGLSVKDEEWDKVDLQNGGSVVLIAAKVLYFGVGGCLQDFLNRVERENGWWTLVKEWTRGVGRKVVRVGW